jgi:hypothetical protein
MHVFFEGSDRARATLYHVIESNSKEYFDEFEKEFKRIETIIKNMEAYKFSEKELKLDNAVNRLAALKKIMDGNKKSIANSMN